MACGVPQKCSERYAKLIRAYLLAALALPAGAAAACVIRLGAAAALLPAALSAVCLCAAVYLPEVYVERLSYVRHRDWLMIERGVLWKRTILIPRGQIQYVRLMRSPAERLLKLSTLVIATSGGSVALRGLEPEDAVRLRGLMEKSAAQSGVR